MITHHDFLSMGCFVIHVFIEEITEINFGLLCWVVTTKNTDLKLSRAW